MFYAVNTVLHCKLFFISIVMKLNMDDAIESFRIINGDIKGL